MKHKFEGRSGRGGGSGKREEGLANGEEKGATPGQVWWLSVLGYLGVGVILVAGCC